MEETKSLVNLCVELSPRNRTFVHPAVYDAATGILTAGWQTSFGTQLDLHLALSYTNQVVSSRLWVDKAADLATYMPIGRVQEVYFQEIKNQRFALLKILVNEPFRYAFEQYMIPGSLGFSTSVAQ